MLAKAVALSLVLGGVGFVANDALAAEIGSAVDVETIYGDWDKVLSYKDGQAINAEVGTNKANIAKNAENISANQKAIDKEVKDRQDAITQERNARTVAELNLGEQITQEKNARVEADNKLGEDIKANKEAINTKADAWETTKNFANVQEQLDTQDNKNKAQDVSIKAHTDAIKANKGAIKNEATTRENEDKKLQAQINKNGIKADTALQVIGNGVMYNHANNLTDGVNLNTKLIGDEAKARDEAIKAETDARIDADNKLSGRIDAEAKTRENAVNALNSRIDQVGSDATKGIAKASALAALHPLDYDPDNKFDIAAAGGFYKGENAFAQGAFYRPNRNVMQSIGTTLTSGDNAYNVGVTFKIGKSGKHTEAGLTTADLYAMIGAMQDKMNQQQKKIEELEAKQAK